MTQQPNVLFCPDLVPQGFTPHAIEAIASSGRCVWNPENLTQAPPVPPVSNTAQTAPITAQLPPQPTDTGASLGAFFIIIMGTAGVMAFMRWRQNREVYGYLEPATRPVHVLPVIDVVTRPNTQNKHPQNIDSPGIPVDSDSKNEGSDSGLFEAYSAQYSEPNPFTQTEQTWIAYQADRTASDVSTGSLYNQLVDLTFADFSKQITPGTFNPIDILRTGNGEIAAKRLCFEWLAHGVNQVGKLCWVLFGSDGQGGGSTAVAAKKLVDGYKAEWVSNSYGRGRR